MMRYLKRMSKKQKSYVLIETKSVGINMFFCVFEGFTEYKVPTQKEETPHHR